MKLGLEQLVNAAYKAALPIRLADIVVKFGYDAIAATTTKVGIDRFYLARYTAIGTGAAFLVAGGAYFLKDPNFSLAAIVSSIYAFTLALATSKFKAYFLTQKEALSESYEGDIATMRFSAFLC